MANLAAVTDADFESTVLKSDKPVLVDFWAEWCGPCRQVAPILDELASEHGDKITFLKMNVDENPVVPSSYRVNGIPTINVYHGGEVVKSIVGARPEGRSAQGARGLHLRVRTLCTGGAGAEHRSRLAPSRPEPGEPVSRPASPAGGRHASSARA